MPKQIKKTMNTTPVQLLWTGGFDSTYRLLELLLVRKQSVQPHYVIDSSRNSTGVELLARDRIQQLMAERSPECRRLLLPTAYHGLTDIRPNAALARCYDEVRARLGMGRQHEWLAFLAEQENIHNFEISGHWNDPAVTIISPFLVEVRNPDGSTYHRVPEDCPNRSVFELFKYFQFPLLRLNKREILSRAREQGLLEYLQHTWYCHRPLHVDPTRAKPCGTCNTCIHRINTAGTAGLGFITLVRHYFVRLCKPRRIRAIRRRQGLAH